MVGGDKYNRSIYIAPGDSYEVYVPLEFWFCRNVGLALPLIALQYHEVKINFEYASVSEMYDNSVNYSDSAMELVDSTGTALTGVTTDAIPLANSALRGTSNASTNLQLNARQRRTPSRTDT